MKENPRAIEKRKERARISRFNYRRGSKKKTTKSAAKAPLRNPTRVAFSLHSTWYVSKLLLCFCFLICCGRITRSGNQIGILRALS